MEYSQLVKSLEEVVNIPVYAVLGSLKQNVVFLSTLQGESNISVISKEVIRLTNKPVAIPALPKKELDFLVYAFDTQKGKEIHSLNVVTLKGEEYEAVSPQMRVISLAYDQKRIAFVGSSLQETALYVVEHGKLSKLATLPPFSFVSDIQGDLILGSGWLKGNPKSHELFIANLSGELKVFTPKQGSNNYAVSLSGEYAHFVSDCENLGESYWVYTLDTKSMNYQRVEFSQKDVYQYNPVEISGFESEQRLLVAKKEGESKIFVDGRALDTPKGVISGATKIGDKVYFSLSSLTTPSKIYLHDGQKLEVVLENKNVELGSTYYTKIKSDIDVPTWVIQPKVEKNPRVAVVYVHGGPWGEVDNRWNLLIAPLLLLGYHVVAPNFRGSTGYGSRFTFMDVGDAGGGDLRDILAAREYASKIANVVGIMGYSYGGYMTLLALGKEPEKWSFGIAGAAVTDWLEMYSLSDSSFKGFIEVLFSGKNEELMRERSPVSYAQNVRAPLCIIHSQNDTRTPLAPVLKYVQKLQQHEKSFELHVIPNLGHAIYTMRDAVDIILPALLFLKKLYG